MKSIFYKIFNDDKDVKEPHNFTNYDEIKLIINNVRYFIFDSNFDGITVGQNLDVYINGDPYCVKNNELMSKIAFLSQNVKTNLHEIAGHINVIFQIYYISPKPINPSKNEEKRNDKEYGEKIEECLFGGLQENIVLPQMLYILDINNYDKTIETFKEEYESYKKKNDYPLSYELKKFLRNLDINPNHINFKHASRIR